MTSETTEPRFIDNFDVILLDVQKTFMFGVDRFSPEEDYAATYQSLGGNHLDEATISAVVNGSFEYLITRYNDPAYFDDFPSLDEAMASVDMVKSLKETELQTLMRTFARHECGTVPHEYADCLRELATTHQLGIVSNIWAPKDTWLNEFRNAGILHLFDKMVFSSDSRSIKPSPALFREAMAAYDTDLNRILFVGDSPAYDIIGAKGVKLSTVLTLNHGPVPSIAPPPDRMVSDLLQLLKEPA